MATSAKYLLLGIVYLGSNTFITHTKPMSSTIEKGWLSRAIIPAIVRVIFRAVG